MTIWFTHLLHLRYPSIFNPHSWDHSIWKLQKKSHSTLRAKRATFFIFSGQKFIKNAKSEKLNCDIFWWFSNTVEMLEKKRTFLLEFWIINLTLFLNWHVPSLIDVECADLISNSALWPPSQLALCISIQKAIFPEFWRTCCLRRLETVTFH